MYSRSHLATIIIMRPASVLSGMVLLFTAVYQIAFSRFVRTHGFFRTASPIGNMDCAKIQGLEACEKLIIHAPTGLVYLACSTSYSRTQWAPYFAIYNESGRSLTDHVSIYDPTTSSVIRTKLSGFTDPRGLNVHGMDVVTSRADPSQLYLYLVNHRPQADGSSAQVGSDSVIELFKTTVGSDTLTHIKTFKDPNVIMTPNDISGSPDGTSFFFTNDRESRTAPVGMGALIHWATHPGSTSVGYCHINGGCKFAARGLPAANGIVRLDDDTIWVANSYSALIQIYARRVDNTLVLTDQILLDRCPDNLTIDSEGSVYAAAFVSTSAFGKHVRDQTYPSPPSVFKITHHNATYDVERIFEDDGLLVSAITTAFGDPARRRLYMHGLMVPSLVSCKM